jgi:glyoxylase-like metal-dependent hydrolase (beta-lactamase superfamily II)
LPPIDLPDTVRFIERDWLSSNQVMLFDGDEATVVDTGYVKHAAVTEAVVGDWLRQRHCRLTRIVNTHLHSDHCGGNRRLANAFGARIGVPQASFPDVERWDEQALTYTATGQRCDRFHADFGISPGDRLTMGGLLWDALAAPGHDPKSLIFYCRDARLLISADALWEQGFGVIFPELEGESGYAEQQAILDRIETLDVDCVLPGHGPAFTDVGAALAVARARLASLRGNPARLARHALKVLVKYLMLDREVAGRDEFARHLARASVPMAAAARLGLEPLDAVCAAIDDLLDNGHLRLEAGQLSNPEPAIP